MSFWAEELLRAAQDAVLESARQRELTEVVEWARAADNECHRLKKQLKSAQHDADAAERRAYEAEQRNEHLEMLLGVEQKDALYEEVLRKSLSLAINVLLEEVYAGYAGEPGSLIAPGEHFRLIALIREIQFQTLRRTIDERVEAGTMTEESEAEFDQYLQQLNETRERVFSRVDRDQCYSIMSMAKEQTSRLVVSDFWRDFYRSLSLPKAG